MYKVVVTMRDGTVVQYVSNDSLSERVYSEELNNQFIIFYTENGNEMALPADDIAAIMCREEVYES